MIYVPDKNDFSCYVIQNQDTIRGYETTPTTNATIFYRDYYINSGYIYKDGYQTFNQYTTIPTCIDMNNITSEVYYRTDFHNILIIFIIMSIFAFLIPIKIFMRLFRRFN